MSQFFAYLPMQVFQDTRLGLIDIRVLASIWSHGNQVGQVVFPSRDAIRQRLGNLYCDAVISRAISRLVKAGYLARQQGRGPNSYILQCPGGQDAPSNSDRIGTETVTDSVTVTESVTVTDSSINSDRFGQETVTDSDDIEITIERTIETTIIDNDAHASQREGKQPGGASPGGQGGHEGEPAKPVERAKSKRCIPDDWQPSPRCWELLEQAGIEAAFAGTLIGEFVLYWQERGEKRPGWDATFLNNAKAQWMREQERRQGGSSTPLRPVAGSSPSGRGDFRTWGEQRQQRNVAVALDWANTTHEDCLDAQR